MPTHVIAVQPQLPLLEAISIMEKERISCLLVTRGRTPVGILTERDLSRFMYRAGNDAGGYLVRDIMSSNVVTIKENEDLYAAYSLMCGRGIRHLAIVDSEGRAAGIMTFSDLMTRLGAEFLSEVRTVGDVMSKNVVTMERQDDVRRAWHLMSEKNVSSVLVVEDKRPLGILTERDVARFISHNVLLDKLQVGEVMNTPVHTVAPERYIFEAVGRMEELEVRHLAVVDDAGVLLGVITQSDMVASLIRRYAHLEFMVRKRTRQLIRKNEELEYSNQQLRHLDDMKSAFLSSVSHELRTPLTSLLGFAKLTSRTFVQRFGSLAAGDEKLERQAARIQNNLNVLVMEGERMSRLINDFLDLTKIEAGHLDWRDSLISVSDFVMHACHAVRAQFEDKPEVELHVTVQEKLPQIFADMDRLLQVMINLLNNAAKFTEKGCVSVEAVNVDDDFVEVRVADTGLGIPPGEVLKIFDKFHQLEQRDKKGTMEGTGLGLAICKEIVEHYNGRIWCESAVGKGSVFKFRLPVSRDVGLATYEEALVQPVVQTANDSAPLVLAVDDNPGIREYLQQLFDSEGFRIITAKDGETALRVAEEVRPQCVLMDLMMPGIDGSEAIRRLRENPVTSDIPVAVLSAYPYRMVHGSDANLAKPVDEELLLQTVRGLIRGGRIQGRKCILVPNPKEHGNMLMISSGKLRYVRPEELRQNLLHKFSGTVYVSGGEGDEAALQMLSNIDDVLVCILPE